MQNGRSSQWAALMDPERRNFECARIFDRVLTRFEREHCADSGPMPFQMYVESSTRDIQNLLLLELVVLDAELRIESGDVPDPDDYSAPLAIDPTVASQLIQSAYRNIEVRSKEEEAEEGELGIRPDSRSRPRKPDEPSIHTLLPGPVPPEPALTQAAGHDHRILIRELVLRSNDTQAQDLVQQRVDELKDCPEFVVPRIEPSQQGLRLIYDVGKATTLEEVLNRPTTDHAARIELFELVRQAVLRIHEAGCVHGHLNPKTIFTNGDCVSFADFWVPALDPHRHLPTATATPYLLSRLEHHAAGIQFRPPQPADDLWSLYCLCFLTLTGRSPFAGATAGQVLWNRQNLGLVFTAESGHQIPPSMQDFLARGLSDEPEARQSAAAFQTEWPRLFEQIRRPKPATPQPISQAPSAIARFKLLLILVAFLVIVVGLVGSLWIQNSSVYDLAARIESLESQLADNRPSPPSSALRLAAFQTSREHNDHFVRLNLGNLATGRYVVFLEYAIDQERWDVQRHVDQYLLNWTGDAARSTLSRVGASRGSTAVSPDQDQPGFQLRLDGTHVMTDWPGNSAAAIWAIQIPAETMTEQQDQD